MRISRYCIKSAHSLGPSSISLQPYSFFNNNIHSDELFQLSSTFNAAPQHYVSSISRHGGWKTTMKRKHPGADEEATNTQPTELGVAKVSLQYERKSNPD